MSFDLMEQVFRNGPEKAMHRWVLMYLAHRTTPTGCYPTVERIARDTGLQSRSVKRIIAELEQDGFIRRLKEKSGGRVMRTKYLVICNGVRQTPSDGAVESPTRTSMVTLKTNNGDIQPIVYKEGKNVKKIARSVHANFHEGMAFLKEQIGPLGNPPAQGAALKWMLDHFTIDQIKKYFLQQKRDFSDGYSCTFTSLKKQIGQYAKADEEPVIERLPIADDYQEARERERQNQIERSRAKRPEPLGRVL